MYLLVFIPHLMVLSILALIAVLLDQTSVRRMQIPGDSLHIFRVCLLFALLGTEGRH